jgi:hypothetical protein
VSCFGFRLLHQQGQRTLDLRQVAVEPFLRRLPMPKSLELYLDQPDGTPSWFLAPTVSCPGSSASAILMALDGSPGNAHAWLSAATSPGWRSCAATLASPLPGGSSEN